MASFRAKPYTPGAGSRDDKANVMRGVNMVTVCKGLVDSFGWHEVELALQAVGRFGGTIVHASCLASRHANDRDEMLMSAGNECRAGWNPWGRKSHARFTRNVQSRQKERIAVRRQHAPCACAGDRSFGDNAGGGDMLHPMFWRCAGMVLTRPPVQ